MIGQNRSRRTRVANAALYLVRQGVDVHVLFGQRAKEQAFTGHPFRPENMVLIQEHMHICDVRAWGQPDAPTTNQCFCQYKYFA